MKINVIKHRLWLYGISILLTLIGTYAPNFLPLNLGIDLSGGTLLEVKTSARLTDTDLARYAKEYVMFPTNQGYLIKAKELQKDELVTRLAQTDKNTTVLRHEEISSSFSGELKKKSVLYIIFVLLAIGLYVSISFWRGGSTKISGPLLGLVVVLCLFHDVLATFGIFLILSALYNYYLDLTIITALLVVAGFSVHDTIVVFDRLRENLTKVSRVDETVFNQAINETLVRSVNTSVTAVLSILPLVFLLPSIQGFLLTLIFGIAIGTYSSIFVATPLVYDWQK